MNIIGFTLGNNAKTVAVSTNAMRKLEYDRLTVIPKALCESLAPHIDEEELNDTIDVQLLSHLVGDVSEGGFDEATLSSLYDLKAASRKSKADSHTKKKKTPQKKVKLSIPPVVSR